MKINQVRFEKIPRDEKVFLFRSCVANEIYPGIESCFHKILDIIGTKWIESDDQTCCGGVFENFAPTLTTIATGALNFSIIEELGIRDILTPCNECLSVLLDTKEYLEKEENKRRVDEILKEVGRKVKNDVEIFHTGEFIFKNLDKIIPLKKIDLSGFKIACHYGCHYIRIHRDIILDDPVEPHILDEIAEKLGATVVQYEEKYLCCGMGYIQRQIHPNKSLEISYKKIKSIAEAKPDMILTICPSCFNILDNAQFELEIEKDFEEKVPVIHLTQLVGLYLGLDPIDDLGLDMNKIPILPLLMEKLAPPQ